MRALRLLAVAAGLVALAVTAGSSRAERQSTPVPRRGGRRGPGRHVRLDPSGRRRVLGLQRARRARRRADRGQPDARSGVRPRAAASPRSPKASGTPVRSRKEGGAKCWGAIYFGALGDGTPTRHRTSVDVGGLERRREGDLGRLGRRLRSHGLRRREVLGLQLPWPARRRDVDRSCDAGRRFGADERRPLRSRPG